jgi:hypothetical protein
MRTKNISLLSALLLSLALAGCGASGGVSEPQETCSYRSSDTLSACVRLKTISPSPSLPNVQAGSLYVGDALAFEARVDTPNYYEAAQPQWDESGVWVIYNGVLRQPTQSVTTVSGYNVETRAKWSATLNMSGGRSISGGRVYWNHTESVGTTRWSVKVDGTDMRKES